MPRKLLVADLLCGAGGTSSGIIRALLAMGWTIDQIVLVCLNHWQIAIDTHTLNHPYARHYCQDIATARPSIIVPEGYLDLFAASPTCTHHSTARGGKPTSDQQRSDPWHIITWFTELRVKRAIIENVWEYTGWGPVDPRTMRPIKKRKGEYFRAWEDTIWKLGATAIEYHKLNAANYGGATTRQRFIMKIRFDKVAIGWAPITHRKREEGRLELFPTVKPWRAAREIINWNHKGRSIFGRPIPLAPKTLARILAGAVKFGWPEPLLRRIAGELTRSLRHNLKRSFGLRHARDAKARALARKRVREYAAWLRRAAPRLAAGRAAAGAPSPMVVVLRQNADGRSIGEPVPAITAAGSHLGAAEPIFINGRKNNTAKPVSSEPVRTLDTKGGVWLAEPFILNRHGDNGGTRAHSIHEPAPTADCAGGGYIVEPFVLSQGAGGAPRETSEPVPTIPCDGAHALVVPYYGRGSGETCTSTEQPLPTATSKARFAMVMPITHSDGSHRARDPDTDPIPTLTTANRGEFAFITAQFGERDGQAPRVHDIAEPAPTIAATGHINLVEPGPEWDCLYRMFETDELARAMGLDDYQFTGTKTDIIKQIGNAVSVEMMEAEIKAFMSDAMPARRPAAGDRPIKLAAAE